MSNAITAAREPLTDGGEVLRRALEDSAALRRLMAKWQVTITLGGKLRGKRGPAWTPEAFCDLAIAAIDRQIAAGSRLVHMTWGRAGEATVWEPVEDSDGDE